MPIRMAYWFLMLTMVATMFGCAPELDGAHCTSSDDCTGTLVCAAGRCVPGVQTDATPPESDGSTEGDVLPSPADAQADSTPDAETMDQDSSTGGTKTDADFPPDTTTPDEGVVNEDGAVADSGTPPDDATVDAGAGDANQAGDSNVPPEPDMLAPPADMATPPADQGQPGSDMAVPQADAGCIGGCIHCDASPEVCDGADNDCDGEVDEDDPQLGAPCLNPNFDGVCAQGQFICQGQMGLWCEGTEPTDPMDMCDGLDTDCDGQTDEDCHCDPRDYEPAMTICGIGACRAQGQTSCVNGRVENSCVAGNPAAQDDTTCNGVDEDCDGFTDEDFEITVTECGVGACAATGELSCQNGNTANSCTPGTASAEVCDGADNDCDGQTDEDCHIGDPCTVGEGLCQRTGVIGALGTCSVIAGLPTPELCDGMDNDCDGLTDEADGGGLLTQSCYTGTAGTRGVGLCHAGQQVCLGGVFGACQGEVTPVAETCDNADNDCDGSVDNNVPEDGTVCNTGNLGICSSGLSLCAQGILSCVQDEQPLAVDDCGTALDEDCDGAVNNGCQCNPGEVVDCYTGPAGTEGVGLCHGGTGTCNARGDGIDGCNGEVLPTPEQICDQADNDCNGVVDNVPLSGNECRTGQGACERVGTLECQPGHPSLQCSAMAGLPSAEVCDTVDNDCDGQTDENEDGGPLTRSCYTGPAGTEGVGLCHSGEQACVNGNFGICLGQQLPAAELCDAQDNNCNGSTDEGFGLGAVCNAGIGACNRGGHMVCAPDRQSSVCDAVPAEPTPETCDNIDNNCNGSTDEGNPGGGADCNVGGGGVGMCGQGHLSCQNGVLACQANQPAPETCNGVDEDCDGRINNGFNQQPGSPECWCKDQDGDGTFDCTRSGVSIEDLNRQMYNLPWFRKIPTQGIACNDRADFDGAISCP